MGVAVIEAIFASIIVEAGVPDALVGADNTGEEVLVTGINVTSASGVLGL